MTKFGATLLAAASAAALWAAAGSAGAAIVLTTGQFGGTGVHSDPGLTAATVTGLAGGDLVTFSTTGDLLHTSGMGESDYNAVDGSMNDLSVAFANFYGAVTFDLAVPPPPPQQTSTLHLSVNGGAFTFDVPNLTILDPLNNGQNKFTLTASGGDSIHTLDFTFDPGVSDIREIRVGPAVTAVAAVPEPATWALMILGFGGVGGLLRRRRHSAPAAA